MNKEEFKKVYLRTLRKLATIGVYTPVAVASGGSLLMHGLRQQTDDIDADVGEEAWALLLAHGFEVDASKGVEIIHLLPKVDIHRGNPEDHYVVKDGVLCQDLESVLQLKYRLRREKDEQDIANLHRALGVHDE